MMKYISEDNYKIVQSLLKVFSERIQLDYNNAENHIGDDKLLPTINKVIASMEILNNSLKDLMEDKC